MHLIAIAVYRRLRSLSCLSNFTQICVYIAGQTDRYALTQNTRVSKQDMDLIYLKSF